MTQTEQQQLGKTLWNIADQLRGAMNAEDFRFNESIKTNTEEHNKFLEELGLPPI